MFTAVSWAGRQPEAPGGHMGGAQAEGRPGCILLSTEKEPGGVSKAFCSRRTRQPLSCWALELGLKWGVAQTTPFKLDKMPLNAAQATKWQRWPGDKRSQPGWGWGKTPPSPQESSSLASPPAPGAHPHLSPRNQEAAGASPLGAGLRIRHNWVCRAQPPTQDEGSDTSVTLRGIKYTSPSGSPSPPAVQAPPNFHHQRAKGPLPGTFG